MRTSTAFEAELLALIDAPLKHAHYYVVKLRLSDGKRKKTLELAVERTDDAGMTVEDCGEVSTTVSALLDVADPIEGAYDLEVSSPGLERPLTVLEDFEDYQGEEVAVELTMALNGRKKFKGTIESVDGENITLSKGEERYTLAFGQMKYAHLVETEEMIRALLNAS